MTAESPTSTRIEAQVADSSGPLTPCASTQSISNLNFGIDCFDTVRPLVLAKRISLVRPAPAVHQPSLEDGAVILVPHVSRESAFPRRADCASTNRGTQPSLDQFPIRDLSWTARSVGSQARLTRKARNILVFRTAHVRSSFGQTVQVDVRWPDADSRSRTRSATSESASRRSRTASSVQAADTSSRSDSYLRRAPMRRHARSWPVHSRNDIAPPTGTRSTRNARCTARAKGQDREADHEQHLFRGATAARPRTFTIRAEPRTERVVSGLQALEQFFVRAGAGVDERER